MGVQASRTYDASGGVRVYYVTMKSQKNGRRAGVFVSLRYVIQALSGRRRRFAAGKFWGLKELRRCFG